MNSFSPPSPRICGGSQRSSRDHRHIRVSASSRAPAKASGSSYALKSGDPGVIANCCRRAVSTGLPPGSLQQRNSGDSPSMNRTISAALSDQSESFNRQYRPDCKAITLASQRRRSGAAAGFRNLTGNQNGRNAIWAFNNSTTTVGFCRRGTAGGQALRERYQDTVRQHSAR